MRRFLRYLAAITASCLLAACGGGGGGSSATSTTTSTADFNVYAAVKNYYLVSFVQNVNLTSLNANNLTGTGTLTSSVVPNSVATWYSFQKPYCGNNTSSLTKVFQSTSIRLSNSQSLSSSSTSYFDGDAKPFLYDDLYVHTYVRPPQAAKVNSGSLLFAATDTPKYFVTFPGVTCADTASYLRDISVNWTLEPDTTSTAVLKLTEVERTLGALKSTSTTYTNLKIQTDGTILSRRYETSTTDSPIVLRFD